MTKEDCNNCFYIRKKDDKYYCDAYKDYPEFKFYEICAFHSEYKPHKYNMIYGIK